MTAYYLDTSAAAKFLVVERESEALSEWADSVSSELVATHLVETELRRFAHRHELPQTAATEILDRVSLFDTSPSLYREAGLLPGRSLRSLDAIHLAASVRLGVDAIVTYDVRLAEAALSLGLPVHAPAAASR